MTAILLAKKGIIATNLIVFSLGLRIQQKQKGIITQKLFFRPN
ncbi:hypothetical protein cce_1625 [Crocosphaera subtropica ATCC 51142]|uniref:Uncharacterized protein n=1 Tax=Crocosphaera subtropica (strain ATCC 51142 / BH68) TaxID=43989 RepID=B1WXY8_CROS5|nr:hypothetical protein cce_1625 [Crocosphaera subtropica ATCC 51142]